MPRDAQISNSSSEAAPKDYTIPGNAELVLRAVQATFTDNGASGDWLPCLTLISDSGHTIARACDQGVKVTAGSDASVSWFPDVKPAAAAGGGTFQWCKVTVGASTPSGSASNPQGGTSMPILAFSTSDPAGYTQVDGFTWTIPDRPQTISGYSQVSGGFPTVLNGDVAIETNKQGGFAIPVFGENGRKVQTTYFAYTLTSQVERGGTWEAWAGGADTHSWVMAITYSSVY